MLVARQQVNETASDSVDGLLAELLRSVRRTVTCLQGAGLEGG